MTDTSSDARVIGQLPGWLKSANRLVRLLQRLGLRLGTIHVIAIPGRVSGQMRATPVSELTLDGRRYLVGGLADADWVKNARAAGWGILKYGRSRERVRLIELDAEQARPILRTFPSKVPGGVRFFQRVYDLPRDPARLPEAFAALAGHAIVFRLESASEATAPAPTAR